MYYVQHIIFVQSKHRAIIINILVCDVLLTVRCAGVHAIAKVFYSRRLPSRQPSTVTLRSIIFIFTRFFFPPLLSPYTVTDVPSGRCGSSQRGFFCSYYPYPYCPRYLLNSLLGLPSSWIVQNEKLTRTGYLLFLVSIFNLIQFVIRC